MGKKKEKLVVFSRCAFVGGYAVCDPGDTAFSKRGFVSFIPCQSKNGDFLSVSRPVFMDYGSGDVGFVVGMLQKAFCGNRSAGLVLFCSMRCFSVVLGSFHSFFRSSGHGLVGNV